MPSQTRRSIARLPAARPTGDDRLDGRRELVGVGELGGGDQPSPDWSTASSTSIA